MIMKREECQIKAGLMKDTHQSATSPERQLKHDMVVKKEEYCDSSLANLPFLDN